jgi:YD repeat-containing protein
MTSDPLTEVPMDSTTNGIRRRATAAVTSALAAATVLAALVVAPPTPADAAGSGHVNLNNRGQVVGFYLDDQGVFRSFVKDRRGRVTTFAVPGAAATLAGGINDRGQVAGTYRDANPGGGTPPPGTVHGFVRQPNGRIATIDLPGFANTAVTDINDRGQLVGQTDAAGQGVGFLRDPDGKLTIIKLPGRAGVQEVLALNDRGQVAGQWDDRPETRTVIEPGTRHGFVWDRGRLTRFDVPGSLATGALGINNHGQVTGAYDDAAGRHHGFVLRRGRFATIDAPGRTVTDAWGINDRGEIVIPDLDTGLTPITNP